MKELVFSKVGSFLDFVRLSNKEFGGNFQRNYFLEYL